MPGVAQGVCGNCQVWDKLALCSFNRLIKEQVKIIDKVMDELEDLKAGTDDEVESGTA